MLRMYLMGNKANAQKENDMQSFRANTQKISDEFPTFPNAPKLKV